MINKQGYLLAKNAKIEQKDLADYKLPEVNFIDDSELLQLPVGTVVTFDSECYVNYFCVCFKVWNENKYIEVEADENNQLNVDKLAWLMYRFQLVGFNSKNYDLPMIALAVQGSDCPHLKRASDFIIKEQANLFSVKQKFKIKIPKYNHVDLIEVAPLQGSLKLYAGRMHCKTMQDLPFDVDLPLNDAQKHIMKLYCANDLNNTELLMNALAQDLKLRAEMSKTYNTDLMSKSDAQIAEAVINKELEKITGYWPKKSVFKQELLLTYNTPDFISYESDVLKKMLDVINNVEFSLDANGSPVMPEELKDYVVSVGNCQYKLGMGGLHSQEKVATHIAQKDWRITEDDVASFYPRIILNQELFPQHLGRPFLEVYENIVNTRLEAKHLAPVLKKKGELELAAVKKKTADSLKIVINGSFGKLGNKYSTLYSPELMLQVTITGQLSLLMLIEMLELGGFECISANTDGVVTKYPIERQEAKRKIIERWERLTKYDTEETEYDALYCRDVNNYLAVKTNGEYAEGSYIDQKLGIKAKGTYCERGSALDSILSKNPQYLICSDAIMCYAKHKTPVAETIKACTDIRRFVTVRNVKGGGQKNGIYLGKVVRFYYAKGEAGYIAYKGSGNKVSESDGAKPLMELPDKLPEDIDYDWYINKAAEMLYESGLIKIPKAIKFF